MGLQVFAQPSFNSPIVTDRALQTNTSQTIPKGSFQFEYGSLVQNDRKLSVPDSSVFTNSNSILIKFGLTERTEVRIIHQYNFVSTQIKDQLLQESFLISPLFALKTTIIDETKYIPQVALHTRIQLPFWGSKDHTPTSPVPTIGFFSSKLLNRKFSTAHGAFMAFNTIDQTTNTILSAQLTYAFNFRTSLTSEFYTFASKGDKSPLYFNAALNYLISPDFKFDLSFGNSFGRDIRSNYLAIGLSGRFLRKRDRIID